MFKFRKRKSLLFIDDILPVEYLGAGYPRSRAIILMANKLGWDVTVYPTRGSGWDFDSVRQTFPKDIKLLQEGQGEAGLLSLLKALKKPFDVVLVSRAHNRLALARTLSQVSSQAVGNRFVYDSEAIFAERDILAKRLEGYDVSNSDAKKLIKSEIKIMAEGMDAISCVSRRDMSIFNANQENLRGRIFELNFPVNIRPNTPSFKDRQGLIFVGRLMAQDAPNFKGLSWFIKKVFPIIRKENPQITLDIVGPFLPDLIDSQSDGVNWLGVINDLGPYYDKSRLFIAPVFIASGIPLKIINAVANGLPVVTTNRMRELLDWPSGAMLNADIEIDFARNVLDIYDSEQFWKATQKISQELVNKHFSEAVFKRNLSLLLEDS